MTETIPHEIISLVEDLREQLAALSARVKELELAAHPQPAPVPVPVPIPVPAAPAPAPAPVAEKRETITEQELIAISGALAAYLGVRVHIRQIRLISSRAWASEGRVSIQASHRLHS